MIQKGVPKRDRATPGLLKIFQILDTLYNWQIIITQSICPDTIMFKESTFCLTPFLSCSIRWNVRLCVCHLPMPFLFKAFPWETQSDLISFHGSHLGITYLHTLGQYVFGVSRPAFA